MRSDGIAVIRHLSNQKSYNGVLREIFTQDGCDIFAKIYVRKENKKPDRKIRYVNFILKIKRFEREENLSHALQILRAPL